MAIRNLFHDLNQLHFLYAELSYGIVLLKTRLTIRTNCKFKRTPLFRLALQLCESMHKLSNVWSMWMRILDMSVYVHVILHNVVKPFEPI